MSIHNYLKHWCRDTCKKQIIFSQCVFKHLSMPRRNFSLVARYSLKFTRCSLLVVKSLVTRCKIRSLLVAELLVAKNYSLLFAEVARCKNSLVTRCKIRSLLVAEVARCKKSLVTRCKFRSLVVAEVAPCKKSLITRCRIRSLLAAEVARCKNLFVVKNHSLLVAKFGYGRQDLNEFESVY